MTGLAVIIGAATPPGRLHAAAVTLAGLAAEPGAVVDLGAAPLDVADGRAVEDHGEPTRAAIATVEAADAVVIASPVYRASFPGVLKNLLDLLPVAALRDKPVGLVVVGGSLHHYLAVDSHLRLVLAWFGALAAPTSVYLTGQDFGEDRIPLEAATAELRELHRTVLVLAERLRGERLGPEPLAAKAW